MRIGDLDGASETTDRARLQEGQVLSAEIPGPPAGVQRAVSAAH